MRWVHDILKIIMNGNGNVEKFDNSPDTFKRKLKDREFKKSRKSRNQILRNISRAQNVVDIPVPILDIG